MDRLKLKEKVLEKAKERQEEIINDFRSRINDIRGSEVNLNEGQYDHDQQSLDESGLERVDKLADQLNFAVDEIDLLNKMQITGKTHERVGLGSIVKTDKMTFFPSVSVEKFNVDGQEFFGISAKAPLFEQMKGKRQGESFSYNGETYKIVDLY